MVQFRDHVHEIVARRELIVARDLGAIEAGAHRDGAAGPLVRPELHARDADDDCVRPKAQFAEELENKRPARKD
jgi:hypothetical protein